MRIASFYSPLRGIALEDVWHDQEECPIGRSIALADRIAGREPSGKRCTFCTLLDKPGTSPKQ